MPFWGHLFFFGFNRLPQCDCLAFLQTILEKFLNTDAIRFNKAFLILIFNQLK